MIIVRFLWVLDYWVLGSGSEVLYLELVKF